MSTRPRSLYVHVPFCARRCFYCDFAVEATREPPVREWVDAIRAEMELTAADRGWETPLELETLYVGGGTPSLLGQGAMSALLEALTPYVSLTSGAEWTCEANPESFNAALAEDWRAAGVNRVSLGAQTFHAGSLRWMGRLHGSDGPADALQAARRGGFDNVSIDLIFGLPDRLGRDWSADLDGVIGLTPEHVSLYGLTAETGAPLGRRVTEGREVLADEDRYADEFLLAHEKLVAAGFEHYEVSNFGRPGRASRHNFVYWDGAPYLALGPGAHGFDRPVRRWNVRSWSSYRDALRAGRLPLDGEEVIDSEAEGLERVWLGLRTNRGYSLEGVSEAQRLMVELWVRNQLAGTRDGVVFLSPEGWLLLDRLAVEFHAAGEARSPKRRLTKGAA